MKREARFAKKKLLKKDMTATEITIKSSSAVIEYHWRENGITYYERKKISRKKALELVKKFIDTNKWMLTQKPARTITTFLFEGYVK